MNSAIAPPTTKTDNDVTIYITPRTFGSVVRMYARNFEPRPGRATGYGRVATGRGATAVMSTPPTARGHTGMPTTVCRAGLDVSLFLRSVFI